MRNAPKPLPILPLLFILTSCNGHIPPRPEGPICVNGVTQCFCTDLTLPEGMQNYTVPFSSAGCLNNISTTPEHYKKLEEWIEELIQIIEERSNCRNQ